MFRSAVGLSFTSLAMMPDVQMVSSEPVTDKRDAAVQVSVSENRKPYDKACHDAVIQPAFRHLFAIYSEDGR